MGEWPIMSTETDTAATRPRAPVAAVAAVDGRRARAERSREAVVDAILELLREGNDRPGAADIADRAGVSLRSVFRHFDDLESLYAVAVAQHVEAIAPLYVLDPIPAPPGAAVAPLDDRIDVLVRQRARLFEAMTPVRVVAERLRRRSDSIAAGLDQSRRELRRQLGDLFDPELRSLSAADRREVVDALEMATGFAAWHQARDDQGLSVARAQAALRRSLSALLRA
jgi:TetR/AcrR family transcriptional regulator, regulator of autoinduction and epiphytic fitness